MWKRVKNLFTKPKVSEDENGVASQVAEKVEENKEKVSEEKVSENENEVAAEVVEKAEEKKKKKKKIHWKRMLGISKKKKEQEFEELEERTPQFVFPDMEIGSCVINMTWLGVTPKLLKTTLGLEMTQEEINNLYREVLGSRFVLPISDEDSSTPESDGAEEVVPEKDENIDTWKASEVNPDAEWIACFD